MQASESPGYINVLCTTFWLKLVLRPPAATVLLIGSHNMPMLERTVCVPHREMLKFSFCAILSQQRASTICAACQLIRCSAGPTAPLGRASPPHPPSKMDSRIQIASGEDSTSADDLIRGCHSRHQHCAVSLRGNQGWSSIVGGQP